MNIILFDWFSFTSKIDSPESIAEALGLDVKGIEWARVEKNAHGYERRYYFNGINIHYDNPRVEGVWVEMSGQGCRAFDEYSRCDWSVVFNLILERGYHITRLDVAYDDKEDVLDLDKIYREVEKQRYISRFKSWDCHKSNKGLTVYIGSNKSNIMFRIYDKAMERNREEEGHWVRFEIQLRDERAEEFIRQLQNNDIGKLFNGVLNNYLRFVVPSKTDSHKDRWKTQKWWSAFVGDVEKISLWTPCDTEYNLMRCENYAYRQAGNAVNCLIKIKGIKTFLKELKENKPKQSLKYATLIEQHMQNGTSKEDEILKFLEERGSL